MKEFTAGLDLGTWLGRRQAFGMIANKCSAADADCLKNIREKGEYRTMGLTWEQFCPQYLGISRSLADRLIQQREEFGEMYFQLSELVGISAASYRQIAGAVTDGHIEHGGEKIRICAENSGKIAAAVAALHQEAAQAKAEFGRAKAALEITPAAVHRRLTVNRERFDQWLFDLMSIVTSDLPPQSCPEVQGLLVHAIHSLADLAQNLPPNLVPPRNETPDQPAA